MKFLIVSLALAAIAHCAEYQPGYKDPRYPEAYKGAAILRQISEQTDGGWRWNYETENGIAANEEGVVKSVSPNGEADIEVQGGYQYTAPDGQVIAVRYVAGPQGFVPEGAHLPVAPPIPEAILRSLAYNAAHPSKEDEYYQQDPKKPYYPTTPKPYYEGQYTTPKPYYASSVQPTYQPAYNQPTYQPNYPSSFQPGFPQGYTKPSFYTPTAGRR